jgi:hypothetical protein
MNINLLSILKIDKIFKMNGQLPNKKKDAFEIHMSLIKSGL